MLRVPLLLSLAVLGLMPALASAQTSEACGVVPTVQPLRNEDKSKKEVTYAGEVHNRGNRTARFTSARLAIVNRTNGKILGEGTATLTPSTLAPGESAKFKVTASNEGSEYLDVRVDEKLTFEASRCDDSGAGGSAAGATCDVVVSQPFEKAIDDQAHTITFSGSVENRGNGTAKNVQVTGWVISQDKVLEKRQSPSEPRDLGPGERGAFSVVIPLEPGQRKSINDRVTVDSDRCD